MYIQSVFTSVIICFSIFTYVNTEVKEMHTRVCRRIYRLNLLYSQANNSLQCICIRLCTYVRERMWIGDMYQFSL